MIRANDPQGLLAVIGVTIALRQGWARRSMGACVTYGDKRYVIDSLRGRLAPVASAAQCLSCGPELSESLRRTTTRNSRHVIRGTMEMRREIRYRLDAPAVFSWDGGPHRKFQGEGVTRDISVQGAFILTATIPPPNCAIHVDLLLPSLSGMEAVVHISGKARVIRV